MEQQYLDQAAKHDVLGPHYFSARDVVEKALHRFHSDDFDPMVKKIIDIIYERFLAAVQDAILFDVESNLQGHLWHGTDESVKALLSGQKWAIERYCTKMPYDDGAEIREAVAKLIPVELQDARVKDLEAEVERLKKDLNFYRQR